MPRPTKRAAKTAVVDELGVEKLASSGLDLDDAKTLGINILSGDQTQKLRKSFKPLKSLQINYYDPRTGKPLTDWPGGNDGFYRVRYLEKGTDFASLAEKKPARYVQPPATAPVAYYPLNQDWKDILQDPRVPLLLTEGELKAAKACKEGFPTIGIGGVYNWRAHKMGLTWLESLDFVTWRRRNVYICFDSDYRNNPMVLHALRELSEELGRRGAFAHLVSLPNLEDLEKVGLDDFLVFAGATAKTQLEALLHEAEPLGLSRVLWGFNERYVYVENPGLIVNQETLAKTTAAAFRDHLESTSSYQERDLRPDGSISFRAVPAAQAWLKWPLRQQACKLTYQPGSGTFIESTRAPMFNVWPGWGLEPKKGDVKPFLKLVDHLFTGATIEEKTWFLRWCAFPLQHPGTKMFSSVLVHGIKHGTGKSLIGYTLGSIYGENFTEIDQDDLHADFNEWVESKQFVMGDDVTGSNKREDNDRLKKMITQKQLRINIKHVPSYVVPDCINYYFTANHPDAFFLEDDDRRNFIWEVTVGPLSELFYVEYNLWLDSGGGAAVFDYLLKLDLGDFNPAAPAFKTAAKERMITTVQSDLASWVRSVLATPDYYLRLGNVVVEKDLFTSKELLAFYDPEKRTGTTANGLGRELARAGVRQVTQGRPIRLSDGSQSRYYSIRNSEKWEAATYNQVVDHLEDWLNPKKPGAKKKVAPGAKKF